MNTVKTMIIAEAGVNHNGSLDMALQLVDQAAQAGADYVKFQSFHATQLVTSDSPKANYQNRQTGNGGQLEMLQKLELGKEEHLAIQQRCTERGIGFLSTAFDLASLNMLRELGISMWKIPSGEITNLPLLRTIAGFRQTILLSTGMSTMGDIEAAMEALLQAGASREQITLLHCTTEYPAPLKEVNLRAMHTLAQAFQTTVGYSDHTLGTEIPLAAVAMGACVIEKHFTMDRSLPGPDHAASLEPAELKHMVQGIRDIELALGNGVKTVTPSESPNRIVARKSIVAATAIQKGERFGGENLTAKRPGLGISPMLLDQLIGKQAQRDYLIDQRISAGELE